MKYHHPLYKSQTEENAARESDYNKFKKEFEALWAKDDDLMGLILKCHLIVEYYMTECLRVSLPGIDRFDEARLSFAQKHHLLTGWTFGFPWIKDAVGSLNTLRNKVAHNIHYTIRDADLEKIYQCMDAMYHVKKEPVKRGKDAVVDFANLAAMALAGWTEEICRHAPKTGAAGYNELCIAGYKRKEEEQEAAQPAPPPDGSPVMGSPSGEA